MVRGAPAGPTAPAVQRDIDPAAAAVQRARQEHDLAGAMGFLGGPAASIDESFAALAPMPVQRKADTHTGLSDDAIGAHAAAGVAGGGQTLPHLETIQRAFGPHDVSGVRAHVGGAAAEASSAIGAHAYATGNDVAFAHQPDLFLAAHEATHVVQQRQGVSLKGAVGQDGDEYEQHADAVAGAVVRGESAAELLGASTVDANSTAVQRTPVAAVAAAAPAAAAAAAPAVADAAATAAAHEIAANLAGAAQGIGTIGGAIAPGESGVQSFTANNLRAESTTKELEMLALVWLINDAVAIWASQHMTSAPGSTTTKETAITSTLPTAGILGGDVETSSKHGDASYGGARAMPSIDSLIDKALAMGVEEKIRATLDAQEQTATKTFTWSDSGSASEDWTGTVGKLKVTSTATSIATKLAFSKAALEIAGVKESGLQGKQVYARIFRNVELTQGDGWSTGYGDRLVVTVVGGSMAPSEKTKDLSFKTEWTWDGSKTYLGILVKAWASDGGAVTIEETGRENTVSDNSWI